MKRREYTQEPTLIPKCLTKKCYFVFKIVVLNTFNNAYVYSF